MRRIAALLGLLLLLAPSFLIQGAAAQDPVQILAIDTYNRTLAPGDTTSFNWTVRNVDPVAYIIRISAHGAPGWSVAVAPAYIANLTTNRAASVQVNVTLPAQIAQGVDQEIKVLFTVDQAGAVVFIASRSAYVTIPSTYAEKRVLGTFPNPLPSPLDNEWGVFLLDVVLWLVISFAILLVIIPVLRKVGKWTKTKVADIILHIIRTPLVVLLFLYGTLQSLEVLDREIPASVQGDLQTVYNVAVVFILVYLGYRIFKDVVIYLARNIAQRTSSKIDDVVVPLVEKIGVAAIGLAGLGLLLGYLHIDLTLFIAGGVVTSMVVSFAAQNTLSNFFSGMFLLADRPFQDNDIIVLADGDWAQVRRVGMLTTRLFRFADASIVTVPNNMLVNEKVANFSNPHDQGRVMMTFDVGYGSDPAKVKRVIRTVIQGNEHILQDAPLKPIVRFDAMADSSLKFFILVWIDNRDNRFDVQDYLNTEIYEAFRREGIEIPFPQRTVHLQVEGSDRGPTAPVELEELVRREARDPPKEQPKE